MSVTFNIPAAPVQTVTVACDFPGCREDNRCGYCKDGFDEKRTSEAPEVNFANANARALMSLLGFSENWAYGVWQPEELAGVRQAIVRARARDKARKDLVVEEHVFVGEVIVSQNEAGITEIRRTCRVISMGNTDEQTLRRLDTLEAVLVYAQEHGWAVAWA